jgi:hypothetical protein
MPVFTFWREPCHKRGTVSVQTQMGADEEEIHDVCIAGKPHVFIGESLALKSASAMIRRSPTLLCRELGHLFTDSMFESGFGMTLKR